MPVACESLPPTCCQPVLQGTMASADAAFLTAAPAVAQEVIRQNQGLSVTSSWHRHCSGLLVGCTSLLASDKQGGSVVQSPLFPTRVCF